MQRVMWKFIVFFLIGLFIAQCSKKDDEVIVEVGSLAIHRAEVLKILKKKYPNQTEFSEIDISSKKDLIEPLILTKLRINAAYDLELENDPEIQNKLVEYRQQVVGSRYFERLIVDQVISKNEIEDFIERQGIELKASHVLVKFNQQKQTAGRTRDEAEILVKDIYQRLKDGADFTEMVEKYSEDPSAKKNKGDLGYFTWGNMVAPFQEAAWNLKVGEMSEPVESRFGFHIILLEDKRSVEGYVPDYSLENKYRIKQMLMRTYGDSAKTLWIKHLEELKTNYEFQANKGEIKRVAGMINNETKNKAISDENFSGSRRDIVFAEWKDHETTLGTLADNYNRQIVNAFRKAQDFETVIHEIERLCLNELVIFDAEQKDIPSDDLVVDQIRAFTENHLNRLVEMKEVGDKVKISDEEVENFYNNNPQKFSKAEEIEIWEIYTIDEKLAGKLEKMARQGQKFETLAKKYSEDKKLKSKGGYVGYKNKNGRGAVSQKAHEIGPGGKIGGPVKYGRGWAVLKTGKKREETLSPFSEVKQKAKNMCKREITEKFKALWETGLREKYPVIYDEEKFKTI
jgi:parvulin-like peptidyl-prolyl isomerase